MEQCLNSMPDDVKMFVWSKQPTTSEECAHYADVFYQMSRMSDSHARSFYDGGKKSAAAGPMQKFGKQGSAGGPVKGFLNLDMRIIMRLIAITMDTMMEVTAILQVDHFLLAIFQRKLLEISKPTTKNNPVLNLRFD